MTCVHARPTRKTSAPPSVEGTGIRARHIADGRWVNTIVYGQRVSACMKKRGIMPMRG